MTLVGSEEEQLRRWIEGQSVHVQFISPDIISFQYHVCCPDFSCCRPHLLAPREERVRFCGASEAEREEMLVSFVIRKLADERHRLTLL